MCTTRARCHGALRLRRRHEPAARAKKAIDDREFARTEDGAGNTAFSQIATGRAEAVDARICMYSQSQALSQDVVRLITRMSHVK